MGARRRLGRADRRAASIISTIINAKDAESAIAAVVRDHNITDPHQIKRLAARRAG
jgi:hypothetical protein